jgi:hypothetical protein
MRGLDLRIQAIASAASVHGKGADHRVEPGDDGVWRGWLRRPGQIGVSPFSIRR